MLGIVHIWVHGMLTYDSIIIYIFYNAPSCLTIITFSISTWKFYFLSYHSLFIFSPIQFWCYLTECDLCEVTSHFCIWPLIILSSLKCLLYLPSRDSIFLVLVIFPPDWQFFLVSFAETVPLSWSLSIGIPQALVFELSASYLYFLSRWSHPVLLVLNIIFSYITTKWKLPTLSSPLYFRLE